MRQHDSIFKRTENRGQIAVAGGPPPQFLEDSQYESAARRLWSFDRRMCDVVLEFADRHRRWIWLAVLVFYLAGFNGQWRMQSDAALYLSLGRNLAQGHGFTYLGQPERLAYPGWPGLIAVTFKTFGTRSLVPENALMLLIALATLAAVYRLFLLHSGRPTAVVVSAGVGLTKAFFCYGFELWTDMPFALGAMTFLAGYEGIVTALRTPQRTAKSRTLDLGLLISGLVIAAATRPTIWPLLTALIVAVVIHVVRRQINLKTIAGGLMLLTILAGFCVAFGWARVGHHGFGQVYEDYLVQRVRGGTSHDVLTHTIAQNIRDLFTWAASDVLFQTRLGPVCNAFLSLLVLSLGVGLFRYRAIWGLWFLFLLAAILISQETLDRYFLPVLPLLVFAWWDLLVRINRTLSIQWGNSIFLVLVGFGGLMNLTKCTGIIIQQHQRPFLASYDKGTYEVMPQFSRLVHDQIGEDAIVLAKSPYGRVTAFLSERNVTNAASLPPDELGKHPIFVVEPSDPATQSLLKVAGLTEQPAMFTVTPSPEHGPLAIPLSLHATRKSNE